MYEKVLEIIEGQMKDEYKLEEIAIFLAELLDAAIDDIKVLKEQVQELKYEQTGYKEDN